MSELNKIEPSISQLPATASSDPVKMRIFLKRRNGDLRAYGTLADFQGYVA
jgi:hypothetical protein